MSISENIEQIKNSLPAHVKLVAISKTKPIEMIEEAYKAGHFMFGENKVQELVQKYEALPKNIEWHYIGHLQSNKVKYMAPFVALIHAVDSLKLLRAIDKEALKNNRKIDCLLQFHIAEEDTKFGLSLDEAIEILDSSEFKKLNNITIAGVMGMATYTSDVEQIRREFKNLHSIFQYLKTNYFSEQLFFKELSMGMSDDYPIAVDEGSTMVRIGSTIFGHR